MTDQQFEKFTELLKPSEPSNNDIFKRVLVPVFIGLSIAFVGWFATKSTQDIESVTTINNTLEFMQLQQNSTNEALKVQINELKHSLDKTIGDIQAKLSAPRFTREDFNREMLYRDQDLKRTQGRVEEIILDLKK